MKQEIHPEWYPDAKVILNGEVIMTVGATKPELNVEIWSGTHPFYTGQQRLLDTEGQVDRFMTRLKKREEMLKAQEEAAQKELPTNLAIDSIGLATRAQNALTEAGLSTVGDLLTYLEEGDDALLAIPGVGRKALIDVKRYLRAEGLIE
jgi:large subunit ribosomal protein L31